MKTKVSKVEIKKDGWNLPKIFLWWPVGHHIKDNHELLEVNVPILEQWVTTQWTVKAWKLLMIFDLSVTFIYRPRFSNSRSMCAHVFVLLFVNGLRFANVLKCYQRWKSVIFLFAEETLTRFINHLCQGHLLVIHRVKIILFCTCMELFVLLTLIRNILPQNFTKVGLLDFSRSGRVKLPKTDVLSKGLISRHFHYTTKYNQISRVLSFMFPKCWSCH